MTTYSFQQLENLWVSAGGNRSAAPFAAAVAEAESSGNSQADSGSSVGLWQINRNHGSLATFDPLGNARAAVSLSNNGQNWRPWCSAYSDNQCGTQGGTYLGPGSNALLRLTAAGGSMNTNVIGGGIIGGSTTSGGTEDTAKLFGIPIPGTGSNPLGNIFGGLFSSALAPLLRAVGAGLEAAAGVVLMIVGIAFVFSAATNSPTGQKITASVQKLGTVGEEVVAA